jgi:hypothetical protein
MAAVADRTNTAAISVVVSSAFIVCILFRLVSNIESSETFNKQSSCLSTD